MARVAAAAFVVAVLSGLVSPVLVALGALPPTSFEPGRGLGLQVGAGLVLALAGVVLAWVAQAGMGASWRIGVDPGERTDLITGGVFAVVRNPVFTAMVMIQVGTAALAPTPLSLIGVGALVLACQLQVRLVEEPHLTTTHPAAYPRYAARTGRFLPLLGRVRRTAGAFDASAQPGTSQATSLHSKSSIEARQSPP